jgi:hypothetical protein
MRVRRRALDRRCVIEAYAAYDCSKKRQPTPQFANWDWHQADDIDQELHRAGLKNGVLAGYRWWDAVEVTVSDLRECAVCADMFPGRSRALGLIEESGALESWMPNPANLWYERIARGEPLDEAAPLVLRPALSAEAPARWYVEDGSGRVIALLKNQASIDRLSAFVAVGYLGVEPDQTSTFMQRPPFRELLCGVSSAYAPTLPR